MAKRKADELEELKEYNQDSKKAKLSVTELNEGNNCLKQLLKKWVAQIREQGLDNPAKLSDEQCQAKIQELLRDLASESSENKFLKDISGSLV